MHEFCISRAGADCRNACAGPDAQGKPSHGWLWGAWTFRFVFLFRNCLRIIMNGVSVLALIVFIVCFLGVLGNNAAAGADKYFFTPPYYYRLGDWLSQVVAFAFVLTFSLVFFGLGSPAAMAVEGLKFGSLFSAGLLKSFDLFFILPGVLAMLAASELGEGVMDDWSGKSTIFNRCESGAKLALGGAACLAAVMLLRGFIYGSPA